MSWTALAAENLVIGLQGLLWLGLILLRLSNISPHSFYSWLANLPNSIGALLALLSLATAYSLGTLLDHIWYLVSVPYLKWNFRRNWKSFLTPSGKRFGGLFYATEDHLLGENGLRDRLLRRRGRIRILRALFFHVPLTWLGLSLNYHSLWTSAFMVVLWLAVVMATLSVHKQYLRMVARQARSPQKQGN